MIYLDKDESFSLSAYVTALGYQSMVLQGYLVERRSDGVYAAPLIPQLFYGASGAQLQTWRQNLTSTGAQTILYRNAGDDPHVPREELYWRKISDHEVERGAQPQPATQPQVQAPSAVTIPSNIVVSLTFLGLTGLILYLATRTRKRR